MPPPTLWGRGEGGAGLVAKAVADTILNIFYFVLVH